MKKLLGPLLAVIALVHVACAQTTRYIVRFRNKAATPYSLSNPAAYLSQRALDRRVRYEIRTDSTDLPVPSPYIDSIRSAGAVTTLNASRWLNAVSIQTTDAAALNRISTLPFVQSVSGIASRFSGKTSWTDRYTDEEDNYPYAQELKLTSDRFNYGFSRDQIHLHQGEFLHNIGLRGQNMIIGLLDGGFNSYLTLPSFDSVRKNGQILDTWDFVAREAGVNEDHPHGMECFSILAANLPGQFVGSAPKAGFYLFRSEDAGSEYPIEEFNWVCAAERTDSAGGDLISSSLGYGAGMSNPAYNHTYAELNGNTTMCAIGADLAAAKGMLVVVAMGNEGTSSWHYLLTPADADSVMSVGAVNSNGLPAGFSGYGPTSDLRVKPDVASLGVAVTIQKNNGNIASGDGTSYACPNIAGLAACLWQGFPEFNNMRVINALKVSGSKADIPDNRIGYGIPDVKKAVMNLLKESATSGISLSNCTATLKWTSKDMRAMRYEIERMLPGENGFTKIAGINGSEDVFGARPTYQYQDAVSNVQPGIVTYRILQVIDTSRAGYMAGYIATLTADLHSDCAGPDIVTILPNPSHGESVIRVNTAAAVPHLVIRVVNSKGQLVWEQNSSKQSGTYPYNIPSSRFPAGKYYVSVYDDNKLMATKELIRL